MADIHFEEEEFSTTFSGRTMLRILSLGRPYLWQFALFLVTVAVISFLDSYFTFLTKRLIDEGIIAGDQAMVVHIITIYAGFAVVQAISVFGMIMIAGALGERIAHDLRERLFTHLQKLSLSYFDRTPVGWIISRVTSDTERLSDLLTWGLLDMTWAVWNIGIAVIFMFIINAPLALIVCGVIPILVFVAVRFRTRIIVQYRLVRKTNSRITGAYNENITGVRVVKAMRREESNLRKFGDLTGEMYTASYRAALLSALFLPAVQIVAALALGAILLYSGLTINTAAITVGGIQAFIFYVTFMLWPVQDIARVYASMQQAIASAERIFSLLDAVPEVADRPQAVHLPSIRGAIKFDGVSFAYGDGAPVLEGFDLAIEPGESIALVGPTGGGKSTIVNLLCRFYEPTGGRIIINGWDYTRITLDSIQSRIGMVLQAPHLFTGTVRENLRYGRLDADDDEIEAAARIAGADEFIRTLADGYEEQVGEGGNNLSTGQKQLISLARAVLADPDLFIMDEATSSIDSRSEAAIQRGLAHLLRDRISFVIAHRLSTIKKAGRILVVEGGRITEAGSHRQLLAAGGHYARLYAHQLIEATAG